MSVALTTTANLLVADAHVLKRPPSSLSASLVLLAPPTASAWSPDSVFLFIASRTAIQRYNPQLNTISDLYSSPEPISHLVCRSQSSLVFATGNKLHVLESAKLLNTFDSHNGRDITSLSLSNDLLASTSAESVHIHNLLLGSHTVLRGLNQPVTTCTFHPHSRARLLVGAGKQLLVYDTTRPSGPNKVIPMNDTSAGHIVSVACSPFSKTLVAVMLPTSVGLIDLDKEKALFRTINLKVPLTSIAFSPEGASIYLGTEHGKLLILDLRALDKPPKAVVISESGVRVETISVQTKVKESGVKAAPTTKVPEGVRRISSTVPPTAAPVQITPKVALSPAKARIARIGSGASPPRRPSTLAASNSNPKVFSPGRNSQANTGVGEVLSKKAVPSISPATRAHRTVTAESASARISSRARSASSTRQVAESVSAKSTKLSVSRPGSSASQRSSIPPVPPLPATARSVLPQSRTPSPDLPSVNADPVTPLRVNRNLPLGTPDFETKGNSKAKGKTVNFREENDENKDVTDEDQKERERERSLSMQISPRRPSSMGLGNSASWAPSPLRNPMPSSPGGGSSAHDLLRGIVRDVMFDFQQEQRAKMVGLHLDLLKMGRGWKQELHKLMEEYVGDLREMREENKRLRDENELLRRGY